MNSARITQNALFALAFLLGCAAIWTGLRTLVLAGQGAVNAPLLLAMGFGAWVVLSAVSRPRRGSHA